METIEFNERTFSDWSMRFMGGVLVIVGLAMFARATWSSFFVAVVMEMMAYLMLMGRRVTKIDFPNRIIDKYFRVGILHFHNPKRLPPIVYLLVRDYKTFVRQRNLYAIGVYEIAYVGHGNRKIVLCYCELKSEVWRVVRLLQRNMELPIRDKTKSHVLDKTTFIELKA
ncbi:MAG: hypothetical protein RIS47_2358 [Bacteroidota bacterium]|jgi:hypothetical protein